MLAWLDRLGETWLDSTLAALVWFGVLTLAMVLTRQPARRTTLARVALCGSLALPLLCVLDLTPELNVTQLSLSLAAPESPGSGIGIGLLTPVRPSWPRFIRPVLVIYLVGVIVELGWLLLGWWGIGRLARGSTAPSQEALALLESLPGESGGRMPRLRLASRVRGPVLLGVVRPVILIPPVLDRPAARETLRLALLHELAHAARRDPLFGLIGGLAHALWWFVPPAWWIRAQARLDQEFQADHWAALGFGSSGSYATALLQLAGPMKLPTTAPKRLSQASAWASRSALFQRVPMLVRCPFPIERVAPWWFRAILIPIGLVGLLGVSGFSLRGALSPSTTLTNSGDRQFHMRWLKIGTQARPKPYSLLIALPSEFELEVDLISDNPAGLVGMSLAGYLLNVGEMPADTGSMRVRLVRSDGSTRLWIDGRLQPIEPSGESPSAWLTVTPAPGHTLELRDLTLTW